jgi:hypothetical protein
MMMLHAFVGRNGVLGGSAILTKERVTRCESFELAEQTNGQARDRSASLMLLRLRFAKLRCTDHSASDRDR